MKNKLSSNRLVTTYNGETIKRSLCKKILGKFYKIGDPSIKDSGECYLVDNKYHRFNNGKIEYDHEIQHYVLIHKNHLKFGVVEVSENGEEIEGYFSPNLTKNVLLVDKGTKKHCISETIAKSLKYREQFSTGLFYPRENNNANYFTKLTKPPISKTNLPYDSRFATNLTTVQYDKFFNPTFSNENLNKLGDFLESNGITFGVEFETSIGYIPDRLCYKYGLIALRDGSIGGLEYVTIPYSGRKGLYALKGVCEELSKRTNYDLKCALHIHLGGIKRNMTNILSSYILGYLTQDNFFNLQPPYKSGGSGIKSKDYCNPLDSSLFKSINSKVNNSNIKNEFSKLFSFVSDGRTFDEYDYDLNKVKSHPSDPEGTRKWQIRSRYRWINFVPIIFGNKKTIEFRQHDATFDFFKVVNFLFNCATFIKIANDYKEDVLNDASDLYKSLKQTPLDSIKIMNSFLLKKCNSELKDIVKHNNEYNKIRANIMKELKDSGDIIGKNTSRYNKMYNDLNLKFWE